MYHYNYYHYQQKLDNIFVFWAQVPRVSEERQRSKLILEVTDMSNPERTCNRSKNVMVSNAHLQTLIQTDKPIYKPGQPGELK